MTRASLGSVTLSEACRWFEDAARDMADAHADEVAYKRVSTAAGHVIAICCAYDGASERVHGFLGAIPEDRLDHAANVSEWSVVDHADVAMHAGRPPELTFYWLWEEAKAAAQHGFWLAKD